MNPLVADLLGADVNAPAPLHNDRPATITRLREKPEHRIMVMLKAQGMSNREIAHALDMNEATVSIVLRQPWCRERLLEIMTKSGVDKIDRFLASEAINSLNTLVEIRDDKDSGANARKAAADSLLDRYLGKPVQKTANLNLNAEDVDLTTMDRELAQLRAQEQVLLGRQTAISN